MRGIMIHSLMARGVAYEDALRTAECVRSEFAGRKLVTREELAAAVADQLGDALAPGPDLFPELITVSGNGSGNPFSKGILSQSLLAAAIDPNDAFEVARDIERKLLFSGVHEVERKDLRRRAYEALEQRVGEKAAQRYLVWRKFQDPEDRPVILLLGGATGTGKTSLALEVAHRLGIQRVLSTDSIRQVMRIMLSPELVPALHVSSFDDAHQGVTAQGTDPVLDTFHSQVSTVAVGVCAAMDRAIAENVSLVLDGVSLVPGLVDLEAYREKADVIFLMVAVLDESSFTKRFESRAKESSRRPSRRYLKHLDAIMKVQDHLLELAERYEVPIVDNDSFEPSAKFIIRYVTEQLQKSEGFDPDELL